MPSPSSVWVTVILYPIRTVVGALLWLRVWWWVDDQGCHLSQLLWQKHKQAILNTGVHKQNCSSLQLFFEKKPSVYKERNCHNCCDKTWQNGMVSFYVPKNIKGQFCPHLHSAAIVTNTKVYFFYLLSMWWLKTAQINRFDHSMIHKSFSPVFLFCHDFKLLSCLLRLLSCFENDRKWMWNWNICFGIRNFQHYYLQHECSLNVRYTFCCYENSTRSIENSFLFMLE